MSDPIADFVTGGDAEGYGLLDTRYAVYLVPPLGSPLKRLADAWIGRDPDLREPIPHPLSDDLAPERIQAITAAPRQYGFHGTLKAPFGLAEGAEAGDLRDAAEAFAGTRDPFAVSLEVASVDGFIALVPAEPSPELDDLAAACVREFDRFRAPLSPEDRERRRPEQLSARQREYLDAWGYPYVLDEFRFHMTLTDRLDDAEEHGRVKALLERFLTPALAGPMPVGDIALSAQTHRVAPFNVVARFPFGRGP